MQQNPKQQAIDAIKNGETILVTVNSNPSVDELSAALGFTVLLNKLEKRATAIFSGDIPPAINFLDPEKTFENTVDSLRDFIIALDKEKADHLRFKADEKTGMVKIFITPYKANITEGDLEFSQGDYNVETVVAIGVKDEADLDKALSGHGRILHDATVISLSNGDKNSGLGTINWHDDSASGYSEMLMTLVEDLKEDKNPLDEQIATAFLTGIVAITDRFSNQRTNSNTMSIAAKLMAAGANQQLIADKLQHSQEPEAKPADDKKAEPKPAKKERSKKSQSAKDSAAADRTMAISHAKSSDSKKAKAGPDDDSKSPKEGSDVKSSVTNRLPDKGLEDSKLPPKLSIDSAPSMGGTLNAVSQKAADDKRYELEKARSQAAMLSHDDSAQGLADEGATQHAKDVEPIELDLHKSDGIRSESKPAKTSSDNDAKNRTHEEARAAIDAALKQSVEGKQPSDLDKLAGPFADGMPAPAGPQSSIDPSLPPMPPMPDFSTLPQLPGEKGAAKAVPPTMPNLGADKLSSTKPVIAADEVVASSQKEQDLSNSLGDILSPSDAPNQAKPELDYEATDPSQFKIPGQ